MEYRDSEEHCLRDALSNQSHQRGQGRLATHRMPAMLTKGRRTLAPGIAELRGRGITTLRAKEPWRLTLGAGDARRSLLLALSDAATHKLYPQTVFFPPPDTTATVIGSVWGKVQLKLIGWLAVIEKQLCPALRYVLYYTLDQF